MAAFGAPEPEPELNESTDAEGNFFVFAENLPVCRLFAAMSTQWRYAGMASAPTGLIYEALPVVCRAQGIALRTVFDGLQLMEYAALGVLNEARK